MYLNPVEQRIIDILKEDIKNTKKDYSILTNNEIAKEMNISVFSIRDKITRLAEKKAIFRRTNFWDNDLKYHQRIIYLAGA